MKIKAQIVQRKIDGVDVKILKIPFHAQLKAVEEDGKMIIEGYASVFDVVDSYYEIVDRGAFKEFLAGNFPRYPKMIWAHDWSQPIGPTLEAREDDRGLFVRGECVAGVQRAEEAYKLVKAGVMTDLSFGFRVDEDQMDPNTGILHLKKISIYEWSPVLVGANPQAMITGFKSGVLDEKLMEAATSAIVEIKEDGGENEPGAAGIDQDPGEPAAPAEPAPAAASAEPETPTDPEPATPAEPEPMAAAADALSSAIVQATKLLSALEALKSASKTAEPASSEGLPKKVDARTEQDQDKTARVVKAILRDAREAKGQIETIIVRAKAVKIT